MLYLKSADFVGVFILPTNTPQFQTKMETMIGQREFENIKYILGVELGQAFYADLDTNGDPQSQRFIDINTELKYSVLRYTFIEVFKQLSIMNTPLGNVQPAQVETPTYPFVTLAMLNDEAAENGRKLRKTILKQSVTYPEYCPACCSTLRKSIL